MSEEKSLPDQLADRIVQIILDEHLEQGDRLPKETELVERLGAGRSSVREAVKLLASRNIVTVRQGSGTYVSSNPGVVDDPLGFTFVEDKARLAADLLEVRFMIEPEMARMAAARASEEDVRRIQEACAKVEELINRGEDHSEVDAAFHRAIAESCGNLVVPRLVPILNASVPLFVQVTNRRLLGETIRTHRSIAEAIAAHNPTAAGDAMYLHLVFNRQLIAELSAKTY